MIKRKKLKEKFTSKNKIYKYLYFYFKIKFFYYIKNKLSYILDFKLFQK